MSGRSWCGSAAALAVGLVTACGDPAGPSDSVLRVGAVYDFTGVGTTGYDCDPARVEPRDDALCGNVSGVLVTAVDTVRAEVRLRTHERRTFAFGPGGAFQGDASGSRRACGVVPAVPCTTATGDAVGTTVTYTDIVCREIADSVGLARPVACVGRADGERVRQVTVSLAAPLAAVGVGAEAARNVAGTVDAAVFTTGRQTRTLGWQLRLR